jgi:hypothetical protein
MNYATYEWAYSLGSGSTNHVTVFQPAYGDRSKRCESSRSSGLTSVFIPFSLPADYIPSLLRHCDVSSIAPTQMAVLKTPKPDQTGDIAARARQEAKILVTLRYSHMTAYKLGIASVMGSLGSVSNVQR